MPEAASATTAIVARPAPTHLRREDERGDREAERRHQPGAEALQRAEADQPADGPTTRGAQHPEPSVKMKRPEMNSFFAAELVGEAAQP